MTNSQMLSAKAIDSKIVGIATSTKNMRKNVQEALVHGVARCLDDGQVGRLTRLIAAMGAGTNVAAAKAWLREYGFVYYNEATESKPAEVKINKKARKACTFASGEEMLEYLMEHAVPWYEMKKPTSVKALKPIDAVIKLAERLDAAVDDDTKEIDLTGVNAGAIEDALLALKAALLRVKGMGQEIKAAA